MTRKEVEMRVTAAILWTTCIVVLLPICAMDTKCPFAIYVAKAKWSDRFTELDLRSIELETEPIVTIDDVVSYSKRQHTMRVTTQVYKKFMKLAVGTVFVVCVGDVRVYYGTIWSDLYSSAVNGIVISKNPSEKEPVIHIQLGYPSPKYFKGSDPRSDPRIILALGESGKLKDN
jgi:hypothetical protein